MRATLMDHLLWRRSEAEKDPESPQYMPAFACVILVLCTGGTIFAIGLPIVACVIWILT